MITWRRPAPREGEWMNRCMRAACKHIHRYRKLQLQLWSLPAFNMLSFLLYNASFPLSHPLTPSSPCSSSPLPPTHPSFSIWVLCIAQLSARLPSLELCTAWHSFSNSPFSPFSIFPLYLSLSSVSVSASSPLSLFHSLPLCPRVARRMIMRSRTEIHQCVTSLFPKSPLRASLPHLPPLAHRPCISIVENIGKSRHAFADNMDNWNLSWFNIFLLVVDLL